MKEKRAYERIRKAFAAAVLSFLAVFTLLFVTTRADEPTHYTVHNTLEFHVEPDGEGGWNLTTSGYNAGGRDNVSAGADGSTTEFDVVYLKIVEDLVNGSYYAVGDSSDYVLSYYLETELEGLEELPACVHVTLNGFRVDMDKRIEEGEYPVAPAVVYRQYRPNNGDPVVVPLEITLQGNCYITNETGPALDSDAELIIKGVVEDGPDPSSPVFSLKNNSSGFVRKQDGTYEEVQSDTEGAVFTGAMSEDIAGLTIDRAVLTCKAETTRACKGHDVKFNIHFKDIELRNFGHMNGQCRLKETLYHGMSSNDSRIWGRGDGSLQIGTDGYEYNGDFTEWPATGTHSFRLKLVGPAAVAEADEEWLAAAAEAGENEAWFAVADSDEDANIIYTESDSRGHLTLQNLDMAVGYSGDGYGSSAEKYPGIFYGVTTGSGENEKALPLTIELVGENEITNLHGDALYADTEVSVTGSGSLDGTVGWWGYWSTKGAVGLGDTDTFLQNIGLSENGGPDGTGKSYSYRGTSYYMQNSSFLTPTHNMPLRTASEESEWYCVGLYDTNGTPIPGTYYYQRFFMTPQDTPLTNDYYYPVTYLMYPVETDDSGNVTKIITAKAPESADSYAKVAFGNTEIDVVVDEDFTATYQTQWLWVHPVDGTYSLDTFYTMDGLVSKERSRGFKTIVNVLDGGRYEIRDDLYALCVINGYVSVDGDIICGLSLINQYEVGYIDDNDNLYIHQFQVEENLQFQFSNHLWPAHKNDVL